MKPKILTIELLARYVTTATANAKEVTAATRRYVGNAKKKKNVGRVAFLRQHSCENFKLKDNSKVGIRLPAATRQENL
jgi:hypothetical protein